MNKDNKFIEISNSKRIWAVGSIHSNLNSIKLLKKFIYENFKKDDRLVILGNIIGLGNNAKETLSKILELRFDLMAKHTLGPNDIIFLRGAQEEMFNKLLQLQIAPNPEEIIRWLFEHGVDKTLESYGYSSKEAIKIASSGTLNITKWTSQLNNTVKKISGHSEYFSNLKHAAFTTSKKILFVNRGVDITRPLSAQNDCFWWGYQNFSQLDKPYNTYRRIVRGYQSEHKNDLKMANNSVVCTLFKQPLSYNKIIAGIFDDSGNIIDLFESD